MDFDELEGWTKLNTDEIMELLNICISSTYFKFNDQFYKQLEGAAMGSPISPIFAELFLQKLENDLIKNNRNIIVWRRYVDDVFCIIRKRKIQEVLSQINKYHASIKFTVEEEQDGKLPFLDIMFYDKPSKSLGHHVYRKSTHTNKYLHSIHITLKHIKLE
jgi:hypothetical protein